MLKAKPAVFAVEEWKKIGGAKQGDEEFAEGSAEDADGVADQLKKKCPPSWLIRLA